jgi:hypothetical protein
VEESLNNSLSTFFRAVFPASWRCTPDIGSKVTGFPAWKGNMEILPHMHDQYLSRDSQMDFQDPKIEEETSW